MWLYVCLEMTKKRLCSVFGLAWLGLILFCYFCFSIVCLCVCFATDFRKLMQYEINFDASRKKVSTSLPLLLLLLSSILLPSSDVVSHATHCKPHTNTCILNWLTKSQKRKYCVIFFFLNAFAVRLSANRRKFFLCSPRCAFQNTITQRLRINIWDGNNGRDTQIHTTNECRYKTRTHAPVSRSMCSDTIRIPKLRKWANKHKRILYMWYMEIWCIIWLLLLRITA